VHNSNKQHLIIPNFTTTMHYQLAIKMPNFSKCNQ